MLNIRHKIQTVANAFGYKISKVYPAREFPLIDILALVMQHRMQHSSDLFFVQIGAHDGQSADPIHQLVKQHHWRGLLVEPQPSAFQKLTTAYQQETQLQFENAAIASEDGTATLYRVREAGTHLPFWYYQIASLDRDRVVDVLERWKADEKNVPLPAAVTDLIEELPIPSLSVKTLLSKHNVDHIDLLVIDTMGFDFEILKMFPFEWIKPSVIHFEHNHLSSDDQAACLKLLIDQGYSLAKVAVDTIAYLNAPTRRWGITGW